MKTIAGRIAHLLCFLACLTAGPAAFATLLTCNPVAPEDLYIIRLDTAALTYSTTVGGIDLLGPQSPLIETPQAMTMALNSSQPHTLDLLAADGSFLGSLQLSGHPLKPKATLHLPANPDGSAKVDRDCTFEDEPGPLYEKLITDANFLASIEQWKKWKEARPPACNSAFESIGYFQQPDQGDPKMAIVIHGVGSNPRAMLPVISILLDQGYSVLAPRLAHHFGKDMKDLDNAKYSEWTDDSDQVWTLARNFNTALDAQTTLVGYSLGGYLATRLGFKHTDFVDRLVLLSPAWFIDPLVSAGSIVGSLLNTSLNAAMHIPIGCALAEGYVPAKAGVQVQNLVLDTPIFEFHGSPVTDLMNPILLVTSPADEAIEPLNALKLCRQHRASCKSATTEGVSHTKLLDSLDKTANGGDQSLHDAISGFLSTPVEDLVN